MQLKHATQLQNIVTELSSIEEFEGKNPSSKQYISGIAKIIDSPVGIHMLTELTD